MLNDQELLKLVITSFLLITLIFNPVALLLCVYLWCNIFCMVANTIFNYFRFDLSISFSLFLAADIASLHSFGAGSYFKAIEKENQNEQYCL